MSQIGFYLDEDTINAALVKALRNANLTDISECLHRKGLKREFASTIFYSVEAK